MRRVAVVVVVLALAVTVGIDMIINTVAALDHINRRSSAHQMEALRTGTVSGGNPSPISWAEPCRP